MNHPTRTRSENNNTGTRRTRDTYFFKRVSNPTVLLPVLLLSLFFSRQAKGFLPSAVNNKNAPSRSSVVAATTTCSGRSRQHVPWLVVVAPPPPPSLHRAATTTPLAKTIAASSLLLRARRKDNEEDDEADDSFPEFSNESLKEEEEFVLEDDNVELQMNDEGDVYEEDIVSEFDDGDEEEEEDEYEEYYEEDDDDDDWDEMEDGGDYELQDDLDDPNYTQQKKAMEASVAARERLRKEESFDALSYLMNDMTEEQAQAFAQLPIQQEVEAMAEKIQLTEQDIEGMDIEKEVALADDILEDPYPTHSAGEVNYLEQDVGVTDQDMISLQEAWKTSQEIENMEPWDRVMVKAESDVWDTLSNETLEEMEACLEEIGGSAYNVTNWLLYDLDFNVTNLILAAVKHNRQAPILFQHWYPQLLTYERYKYARDRNFDFTWHDVERADVSELERYYAGFGYNEIPAKAPGETGIISLEDLDEEEIRMAAFENWMKDVYNPEWDRKDFDDDDMRDEDNVFSNYYEAPEHPDLPTSDEAIEDLEEWDEEMGDDKEDREYKKFMGRDFEYKVVKDEEFEKMFRGHLVVACTGDDSDLEIAEKITRRMDQEFGKQVFVETRVIAHAREEDNVFEVWLESYDIDLLHSKKRASMNTKGWEGPAECDDQQINYLVDRVGFLISDESRYSYRYELAGAD